jgi:hypothetical protein
MYFAFQELVEMSVPKYIGITVRLLRKTQNRVVKKKPVKKYRLSSCFWCPWGDSNTRHAV